MEIEIVLNGDAKSVPSALNLTELLKLLNLSPDRIAIELNRRIVKRDNWPSTVIGSGDRIEIVHFVGGGGV